MSWVICKKTKGGIKNKQTNTYFVQGYPNFARSQLSCRSSQQRDWTVENIFGNLENATLLIVVFRDLSLHISGKINLLSDY